MTGNRVRRRVVLAGALLLAGMLFSPLLPLALIPLEPAGFAAPSAASRAEQGSLALCDATLRAVPGGLPVRSSGPTQPGRAGADCRVSELLRSPAASI